jgi:hypothetical protein
MVIGAVLGFCLGLSKGEFRRRVPLIVSELLERSTALMTKRRQLSIGGAGPLEQRADCPEGHCFKPVSDANARGIIGRESRDGGRRKNRFSRDGVELVPSMEGAEDDAERDVVGEGGLAVGREVVVAGSDGDGAAQAVAGDPGEFVGATKVGD